MATLSPQTVPYPDLGRNVESAKVPINRQARVQFQEKKALPSSVAIWKNPKKSYWICIQELRFDGKKVRPALLIWKISRKLKGGKTHESKESPGSKSVLED